MRGRFWAAALALLLLARGTGVLPRGREMEELALINALAADQTRQGIEVTAVTGVRASENEEPQVLAGAGESLAAACETVQGVQASHAYLGQTGRLLIGEKLARTGLRETLDFVLNHGELRLDTLLYIVRGDAGAGLAASASQTAGETPGEDWRGRTAGQVLSRLAEGEDVLAPALAPERDGTLTPCGWAVLGPDGLRGYLEGEAARGAELLAGLGAGTVVTLPGGAAVELTGVTCLVWDGVLRCRLTGKSDRGTAEELASWGARQLRAALDAGYDCWGLTRQQRLLAPWRAAEDSVRVLNVEVTGKVETRDGRT